MEDVTKLKLIEGTYGLDYYFFLANNFEEVVQEGMPKVVRDKNTGEFFLVEVDHIQFRVTLKSIGKGSLETIQHSVFDILEIFNKEQKEVNRHLVK